ncbi:GNAT family N-acetyltransferase [Jannaschia aquimarina]|uniref:N-acetyltransferase domain-containing protein n=1 Tax=Jannaschia aquimarina TaxID=935700 RepID=A0A0D1CIE6_9RHOB|nr:GNAT family N-acetyltransferase [Jannaschia aquimarina]KIT14482.1 hypothetical protein jaqu_37720 [Jannaschia aquimarina]SNT28746.1 Acetyltransferase (GNAT) family protein [Jannaschia aquimarina]
MPELAPGFHAVPPGHLATIVTHLEMRARPAPREDVAAPEGVRLRSVETPELGWYRALFAEVGGPWLWQSRLAMDDGALGAILHHPNVEVFALEREGRAVGLLELDFREMPQAELAFFGLTGALQGTTAARWMMERALDAIFARPVERLWVHTCTLDHPRALDFYRRTGFAVCGTEVEVLRDPRLAGILPREAGPHVPLAR